MKGTEDLYVVYLLRHKKYLKTNSTNLFLFQILEFFFILFALFLRIFLKI